jgi:hypothetical protein
VLYRADFGVGEVADVSIRLHKGKWTPAIHMKRKDARIFLAVKEIFRQRLHDMTELDAIAEGVSSRLDYAQLWDDLNESPGERWADNPEVTVIRFEVLPA